MSDKNNSLELWTLEKIKEIDSNANLSRGSGCGNDILDIKTWVGFFECRQDHSSKNWIIARMKDWFYSLKKLPLNTQKELFIVKENAFGEKGVWVEGEAFFRILKKAYKEE